MVRIDRVADLDYNDHKHIDVQHFVDTGTKFNFVASLTCSLPEEEYYKAYSYEGKPDPKKLKVEGGLSFTSFDDRNQFEESRRNWLREPEHAYPWENIKPDPLFWRSIKIYKPEIMKGLFK